MQINSAPIFLKITVLLFFLISQIINSQKLHHQTFASGGGSVNNGLQCVGQQSIIGLGQINSGYVQQGFINSVVSLNNKYKNYSRKIDLERPRVFTYPNPFNTSFEISFDSSLNGVWKILVLDLTGKTILKKESTIIQSTIKIDNFYYPEGHYFLHVSNDYYTYIFKILRKN